MQNSPHITLVCGTLGAGKTTLLSHLFSQKPATENWAVIVNEFGAIGIDQAILQAKGAVDIQQIPGGCICCSALGELQNQLQQLIDSNRYQRILIEPTGLSEVDSLVDMIRQLNLHNPVQLDNIICVLAADEVDASRWHTQLSWQNLANMADILVFNKTDLCSTTQLALLEQLGAQLYPPKHQLLFTQQAQLPLAALQSASRPTQAWVFSPSVQPKFGLTAQSQHFIQTQTQSLSFEPHPMLQDFQLQTSAETLSIGWRFCEQAVFDWRALQMLFESLQQPAHGTLLLRMKGVFRVGKPWMLFQWRNQQLSREIIAYRNDSRVEFLFTPVTQEDPSQQAIEIYQKLLNCLQVPA
ncbi:cobalamin biosynthesis protein CobW [Thiosulfatimonas sediminis]|uniref:Cobalamin biosynthesis protein CobW n=1 Tax=Thiosulfatimonas sediminis TaxID=2675054 RepID=A0A6F8PT40_9GAMM|nr:CobW family GTP-binding protein [Thiosulfatimonas sediminis]BBP45194.1 cobalamin biosynthesis protein CobW [Thiosulfatimonas sediminis]